MRHRRRRTVGLALAVCVLTGCTAGEDPGEVSRTSGRPASVVAPPVDPHPLTTLRAAIDLSPAVPGLPAAATAAVAAPDGGAFVLLTTAVLGLPQYLATVGRRGEGFAVVASVPVPRLRPVWGTVLLPDGTVLVAGEFHGREPGYGFLVVDPVSGSTRSSVVIPLEEGTDLASGEVALSADGETVHLLLTSFVDGRQLDLLVAADPVSGRLLGGRDLFEEVRAVSRSSVGPFSTWLFARPHGGVTVVIDAYPAGAGISGVPVLLRYDDVLEPVGEPVLMTAPDGGAQLRAAAAAPDGTVYLGVDAPDGPWLLAAPDGGVTGARVLELDGRGDDEALAVDPAQGWVLTPAAAGAQAVNLATGGTTTVDVGCRSTQDVAQLLPGRGGSSALLIGRCDEPGLGTPMLWITGPSR